MNKKGGDSTSKKEKAKRNCPPPFCGRLSLGWEMSELQALGQQRKAKASGELG